MFIMLDFRNGLGTLWGELVHFELVSDFLLLGLRGASFLYIYLISYKIYKRATSLLWLYQSRRTETDRACLLTHCSRS